MAPYLNQNVIKNASSLFTLLAIVMNLSPINMDVYASDKIIKHIILIGASVGESWQFDKLSSRVNARNYSFEYADAYQFDKSEALNEILNRPNRPDAIILKECAAYFPGDLDLYKSLLTSWIDRCLDAKVIPIPSTVVPVTWSNTVVTGFKIIIKRAIGRIDKIHGFSRIDSILAYNDWIKEYAQERGLVVLDLEAALRVSPENRYLKNELTSGDGLHLNARAYTTLDSIVLPVLEQVKWEQ